MSDLECSIVIPAFRAEDTILPVLNKLVPLLASLDRSFEVIVVVDGSVDATAETIKKVYGSQVEVLEILKNSGKGNALRVGIQAAKAKKYIGFIDADLDISPSALVTAWKKLETIHDISLVVGSKLHKESEVQYPFFRRIQSVLFAKFIDIIFEFGINDTQTGLKLGRAEIVKQASRETQSSGFAFDLEFLLRAKKLGAKFNAVPVEVNYQFTSTISLVKYIQTFMEVFKILKLSRKRD